MGYPYWYYGRNNISNKSTSWNNTRNRKIGTGFSIRHFLTLQENYYYYTFIYGNVFKHPRRMLKSYWNEDKDDWDFHYRDNSAGWKSHKNRHQYEPKIKREHKSIKRSQKCGLF